MSTIKLISGVGGAIGSRYLKNKNQLLFVEYSAGSISKLDWIRPVDSTISQGTTVLKGTWSFDCETGNIGSSCPADIWWEQIDNVKRQMVPRGNARIVNLGIVNFNALTAGAMQLLNYDTSPICGNNDAANKLINNNVFCVQTKEGNYCKIKVVNYGYDLKIQWVTYKLSTGYTKIGTGYTTPEDIAVLSNEQTAYVTERTGNLLKVNLSNANRSAATVVCSGLNSPHQIWIDELHNQAYLVEFANPGRLIRIDLSTGAQTILYSSLNLAIGLVLSSDLAYAYISEQGTGGTVSRISLSSGTKVVIATGLTNPFFMTWADASESSILIAERDPANRISQIDISKTVNNVKLLTNTATAPRPSSIAVIQPGVITVCCDSEIDKLDFLVEITPTGLYKGIGYVPWNLITSNGKADTTIQPQYPFQFGKDSPFGGTLSVMIDHRRAWESKICYYRVLIDDKPRLDVWNDLKLNFANGKYEIIEQMAPKKVGSVDGCYEIHNPVDVYYNTDLGCLLASTTVPNGSHKLTVEFYNKTLVRKENMSHKLFIDNNTCVASIYMPLLDGKSAEPVCGVLKYVDKTHDVTLKYTASHPNGFGTYSYSITKGAYNLDTQSGIVSPVPFEYKKKVKDLLGTCTVAAFAEYLYVATTVINGVGRQSQYDASAIVAFCLAP
ncbi:conserved hypothetical protein [groundwater metagenome]|uniref:Uncharacterized protein n=1 Tax=groundwater metagenome TaxID=717931 RepID=A0A098E7G1_9ZZZZ